MVYSCAIESYPKACKKIMKDELNEGLHEHIIVMFLFIYCLL